MITCTAADIARIIGGNIDFVRATLIRHDELFSRMATGPERDALLRNNAKLRLMTEELPRRIAGRSPFKDRSHVQTCAEEEVRRVLVALTESDIFLKSLRRDG